MLSKGLKEPPFTVNITFNNQDFSLEYIKYNYYKVFYKLYQWSLSQSLLYRVCCTYFTIFQFYFTIFQFYVYCSV